jgi:hypothetical protein
MFGHHHGHHELGEAWHLLDNRFREAFPHLHYEHLRPTLGPNPGLNVSHSIKHLWRAIRCLEEAEIMGQMALSQLSNDLGNLLQVIEEEVTNNIENWLQPQLDEVEEDLQEMLDEIAKIWDAISKLGGTPPSPEVSGDTTLANMEYIELNTPFSNMQVLRSPQSSIPVSAATLKDNICHNSSFYDRESGLTFTWNRNIQDNTNGNLPPVLFVYNASGLYLKELIPGDTNGNALSNAYTIDDVFVSTIVDAQNNVTLVFEISFLNQEIIMYQVSVNQIINHDATKSITQYIVMTDINSQATYNHVVGAPTKFNSMSDFMAQEVIICSYKSGWIMKGTRNDLYNNAMLTTISQPWVTFGVGLNDVMGMNKATASNDGNWLVISNGIRLQSLWADWGAEEPPTDYLLYEDTPATTIFNHMLSRLYRKTLNLDFNSSGKIGTSNQALCPQIVPFSSNYSSGFNMDLFIGLKIAPLNGFDIATNTSYYVFTNDGWTSSIQTNANNNPFVSSEYLNGTRSLAMYSRKALYTIKANLFSLMNDKPLDIDNNNNDFPPVAAGVPYQPTTASGQTPLPSIQSINSNYTGLGSRATDDWTLVVDPYNRWGYFTQILYHGKDPLQTIGTPFDNETTVIWTRQCRFGMHYNTGTATPQTQVIGQWSKMDMDEYMDWRNRINTRLAQYDLQFGMIQGDVTWITNSITALRNTDVAKRLYLNGSTLTLTRQTLSGGALPPDVITLPGITNIDAGNGINITGSGTAGSPMVISTSMATVYSQYQMNASIGWDASGELPNGLVYNFPTVGVAKPAYLISYSIGGSQSSVQVPLSLLESGNVFQLGGIEVQSDGTIITGTLNVHGNSSGSTITITSGDIVTQTTAGVITHYSGYAPGITGMSINTIYAMIPN